MARLGEMNERGLVLTDPDGDQLRIYPTLKPDLLVFVIRDGGAVVLDESKTRQLVEYLQKQLTSRC